MGYIPYNLSFSILLANRPWVWKARGPKLKCQFWRITTSTSSWSVACIEFRGTESTTEGLNIREGGTEQGQQNGQFGTFFSQIVWGKGPKVKNLVEKRHTSRCRWQMSRWRIWQKEGGRLESGIYQFLKYLVRNIQMWLLLNVTAIPLTSLLES